MNTERPVALTIITVNYTITDTVTRFLSGGAYALWFPETLSTRRASEVIRFAHPC